MARARTATRSRGVPARFGPRLGEQLGEQRLLRSLMATPPAGPPVAAASPPDRQERERLAAPHARLRARAARSSISAAHLRLDGARPRAPVARRSRRRRRRPRRSRRASRSSRSMATVSSASRRLSARPASYRRRRAPRGWKWRTTSMSKRVPMIVLASASSPKLRGWKQRHRQLEDALDLGRRRGRSPTAGSRRGSAPRPACARAAACRRTARRARS